MDLILWRHAEAEDGVPDTARRLTPKGEKQAQKVANRKTDRSLTKLGGLVDGRQDRRRKPEHWRKRKSDYSNERRQAFIHEGVAALVGADDHGEPVVTDLMRRDPEEE